MKRCLYISVVVFLLSGFTLKAQESVFTGLKSDIKKADEFFEMQAYQNALDYYLRVAGRKSADKEVLLRVAECYFFLNRVTAAADWYDRYQKEGGTYDKEILFRYANSLQAKQEFQKAIGFLTDYQSLNPDDMEVARKIWQLQNLQYLYEDSIFYEIKPITVNSPDDDFGPTIWDNKLIFSSNRKEIQSVKILDGTTNKPFFDWYQSEVKDTLEEEIGFGYSPPGKFGNEISSKYHKGSLDLSSGGDTLIFVTTNDNPSKSGAYHLKISFAIKVSGKWTVCGDFPYNSREYSLNHPQISEDGKTLYFVSDMPGGYGGTDLYFSEFANGKWSSPVNLGNEINTSQNEGHPFVHENTFYFSSNGHPGLGGIDVFKINRDEKPVNIINLGYPVNTPFDDFGLILNASGRNGYLVSNRMSNTEHDDIFEVRFTKPSYPLTLTGNISFRDYTIESEGGTARLMEAKLELVEVITDKVVATSTTDETGSFSIEIPFESKFLLKVSKEGFGVALVGMEIPRNPKDYLHHDIVIVKEFDQGILYREDEWME